MASTRVVCRNSSRFAKRGALTGNLQLTLFTRHITAREIRRILHESEQGLALILLPLRGVFS